MKKLTLKQLQERIDELERQVRELQARPVYVPVFPPSDVRSSNPFIVPQPTWPPCTTTGTVTHSSKIAQHTGMNDHIQTFN